MCLIKFKLSISPLQPNFEHTPFLFHSFIHSFPIEIVVTGRTNMDIIIICKINRYISIVSHTPVLLIVLKLVKYMLAELVVKNANHLQWN